MRLRALEERLAIVQKYDLGREEGAVIDDWEDPQLELYHSIDRYGFIHDQRLPENGRTERERRVVDKEMSRVDKWVNMIKPEHRNEFFPPGAKHRKTMTNRVWKGVPLRTRGEFWKILLDVDTLKQEQPNMYENMKALARKHSPDIRQIDLDVNRTYRNNAIFRERYCAKQQDLFHVLAAYSMYNAEVGYCQGMSQVAALLLMYLNSEVDAFWGLHKLMVGKLYKMHGLFIPNFPKLRRFQDQYERILLKKLKKLQKHLVKNEVVSGIYTLKWFFQCFLDRLPFSLTLRVWDVYIMEGEQVLLGMAYTILKMHEHRLLKMGMDDLLEFLQQTLENNFGYDDDRVIEELRQNLKELRESRLTTSGESFTDEEPLQPFGLVKVRTAEEELGYRQPFTAKEREFSLHTIQRENETARKLQHMNSQTSIDEGSYDHSLNETVSVEPDTEDRHSDLLEQDISMDIQDSPDRNRSNPVERSESGTPSDRSRGPSEPSGSRSSKYPFLPPSPLPPSREEDELDDTVIAMLAQVGTTDFSGNVVRNPDSIRLQQPPVGAVGRGKPDRLLVEQRRPASADPQKYVQKEDFNKRHSAHIPLCPPQFAGAVRDPGGTGQRSYSPAAGSSPRSPPLPDDNFPHFHRINGGSSSSDSKKLSEQQQYVNRKSSEAGSDISPRSAQNAAKCEISEDQDLQQRRIRSGSKSSKSSRSSRTSRSYYFGENPHDVPNNGGERELLNSSFEGATPHKGEVVRIKVPFQEPQEGSQETGGIHREDKEISPRYNGHRVTIQVNRSSSVKAGPDPNHSSSDNGFNSNNGGFKQQQLSSHSVTKKFVSSSSVRKVNSSEEVHRSSQHLQLSEHRSQGGPNSQGEVLAVFEEEGREVRGGKVVSSHHQYSVQSSNPQMVPVYRSHSPNPSRAREHRNSRSSRHSASDAADALPRRETFF